MSKALWKKFKIGFVMLSTVGLLAACNTTTDYEEDPNMGGDEAPVSDTEMPGEDGTSGSDSGEGETNDN